MADTASLVARVKTEGAEQAARQLEGMAKSADNADAAINKLTPDMFKFEAGTKGTINQLKIQQAFLGKTKDEVALYTAAIKGASEAELKEIATLQQLNTAQKATGSAFKSTGSAAQQVGFQLQDVVVQLQSGTSAFVAIGQQGSQLAGAFGPGGAVLGAVIALASAVGGVLYKSLSDSTANTKDLEAAGKVLSATFQTTKDGALELSDAMISLSTSNEQAYESQLKLAELNAKIQFSESAKAIRGLAGDVGNWSQSLDTAVEKLNAVTSAGGDASQATQDFIKGTDQQSINLRVLKENLDIVGAQYGVNRDLVYDLATAQAAFNKQPSAKAAQDLADAYTIMAQSATKNQDELTKQAVELQKNAAAMRESESATTAATAAQKNHGAAVNTTTQKIKEQNEAQIRALEVQTKTGKDKALEEAKARKESFAAQEGVTKEQIKRFNDAADKAAQVEIARIDKTENDKNSRTEAAAARRDASAAKHAENQAKTQRKSAEEFMNTVDRSGVDQLKKIDETEKQRLEKLAQYQQQGALQAGEFEATKTAIQLNADDARTQELDKRKKAAAEKQGQHDEAIAQIQALNATELELIDVQQKSKEDKQKELREKGIISEEEYQSALLAIAKNSDKKRVDSYSDMLGTTTDNLRTALGEGNKMYKAFAIANAVMNTYQAAVAAYQSAAAIPIVGWVLGPVAAGAAVAAGLANVAKIRSAREQGGNLSAGQISTIAERGKAEVIMPASASRVRTAQQMRQIMGDDSKSNNSGNGGVVIVNNTSAKIDSARTETDDEGRLRIIIGEQMAAETMDSNSGYSKARRATRNMPGYS